MMTEQSMRKKNQNEAFIDLEKSKIAAKQEMR